MSKLCDYRLELLKTHLESTIKFRCNQEVFEAMYMNGFLEGCRRIIYIDGYFLKGSYGGQLLTAEGIDAYNSIYPIA